MSTRAQIESWHKTISELGPRQHEVIDALVSAEPTGLSAWELADRLNRFVHAVRPRLTELKGMGLVYEWGERFCRYTDRHEAVWRIVQPDKQMDLI